MLKSQSLTLCLRLYYVRRPFWFRMIRKIRITNKGILICLWFAITMTINMFDYYFEDFNITNELGVGIMMMWILSLFIKIEVEEIKKSAQTR